MTEHPKKGNSGKWRPQTMMVRGGLTRSQHGETSEALFLNSGFVYDSPEEQSARMAGDKPGYIYSRYANPTVRMFEERLAQIEGAEKLLQCAEKIADNLRLVVNRHDHRQQRIRTAGKDRQTRRIRHGQVGPGRCRRCVRDRRIEVAWLQRAPGAGEIGRTSV